MPPSNLKALPARVNDTIVHGTAWKGLRARFVDSDGDPETITVTAQCRTDTIENGGRLLVTPTVTSQAEGWWLINMSAEQVDTLPIRQVIVEVRGVRPDTDPLSIFYATIDVLGAVDGS